MCVYLMIILAKESKKEQGLVVETDKGMGKILKNGQYSGPMSCCDFFEEELNMPDVVLNELIREGNVKPRGHKYFIANENIKTFLKAAVGNGLFYRNKKNKLNIIEKFEEGEELKGKELCIIEAGNSKLFCMGNTISVGEMQKSIVEIQETQLESMVNGEPMPYMILQIAQKNVCADFFIEYESVLVRMNDRSESVLSLGKKIRRNQFAEKAILKTFLKTKCWREKTKNYYQFTGEDLEREVERLLEAQFNILTEAHQRIASNQKMSIQVSYHMDWFDMKISYDQNKLKMSELAKQLSEQRKQYILIDNEVHLIPKALQDNLQGGTLRDGNWCYPKNQIGNILEMQGEYSHLQLDGIEQLTSYDKVKISEDNPILKELYSYQKDGVRWLLSLYKNGLGGCLADDMGMGKTIQTITFLADEQVSKQNKPSIIIVPQILIQNWKNEFNKFHIDFHINIYHGEERRLDPVAQIIITTYDTAAVSIEELSKLDYNVMIMDEFQKIKNSKTKRYQCIKRLNAHCRIALTGTPVENSLMDIWAMMDMINPGIMGKPREFRKKYIDQKNVEQLRKKIEPFMLRRDKSLLSKELPKKQEQIVYCEFGQEQRKLYDAYIEKARYEIAREADRYEIKDNAEILKALMRLREICDHPYLIPYNENVNKCKRSAKLEMLVNIIKKEYHANGKVVVFSQFVRMLKMISRKLQKEEIPISCVTGETNTKKRHEVLRRFEEQQSGILLISLSASGFGINLTSANVAILCDPWWNPAVEQQAEDRIYRIGQKRDVKIYRLVVKDSIEDKMEQLKAQKRKLGEDILTGLDTTKNIKKVAESIFGKWIVKK